MGSRQAKTGFRMIEIAADLLEARAGRMALRAALSEGALVRIAVARRAIAGEREERPRLVARCAASGYRRVTSRERILRIVCVIETRLIERAKHAVQPAVLGMTLHAVARHAAVDAFPGRNACRDRRVTREALSRGHLLPGLVTLPAIRDPLEREMGARERSRRNQRRRLRAGGPRRRHANHAAEQKY